MKGLLRVVMGGAVLWSAYWGATAWGINSALEHWFTEQEQRGWQVARGDTTLSGYPLRHISHIPLPALADPETGIIWSADWLEFDSPAIWPGHQTLRIAPGEQRLSYYDQSLSLETHGMSANLHLAPGLSLELERLALTAQNWSLNGGDTLSADSLTLSMVQTDTPEHYQITGNIAGLRPGVQLRRVLNAQAALPALLDTLQVDMAVEFDTPWDRRAVEQSRPQPRRIDLTSAEAQWGAMRLKARGALTIDQDGVPTGEIAFQAQAWQEFLNLAQRSGAITPQAHDGATRLLGFMARSSGNQQDLDITLGFRDGYVTLGPVPLGPAPRIFLR